MKREHFCWTVYILGRVSWYLGCSAFRLSTVERCAAAIIRDSGIDRSIPSCLVVRDFPREEKGTLTRQYIPLKLFRNGRGIKRTAAQRLITIRVAMGKLSPLMMKMFHQFTVFFFSSFFPLFIYILLYFLPSTIYLRTRSTTVYMLY